MTSFLKKLLGKCYIHFNLNDKIIAIKKKKTHFSVFSSLFCMHFNLSVMGGQFWFVFFNKSPTCRPSRVFLVIICLTAICFMQTLLVLYQVVKHELWRQDQVSWLWPVPHTPSCWRRRISTQRALGKDPLPAKVNESSPSTIWLHVFLFKWELCMNSCNFSTCFLFNIVQFKCMVSKIKCLF